MLQLFSDSDCDVTPEMAKKYGYKLISMPYSIDGKTIYPYEDFEEFDSHTFYDMLRNGTLPTTSAVGSEKYIEYFEPEFKKGNDILYVHFSRALSATFEVMDKVVSQLLEKYPERKFYKIDTKGISVISLNIAYEIGDMYLAGKSAEEIVEWANTEIYHFAQYFFAEDLKFFKRSGRVTGLAATMGTLIGIRPIIYMDNEGRMVNISKEKGKNKAIERLICMAEKLGDNIKEHRVIIASADASEYAAEIERRLRESFGDDLNIITVPLNPTSGCHCGPSSVGISFHSISR